MGLLGLLRTDPVAFVMLAAVLLYSVIAHEVSHGVVALWFGDTTARDAGRLTASPLPHLDLFGTLSLFLVGFGWAKPVPVNYARLGNSRLAIVAVALAGVTINIIIAFICLLLLHLGVFAGSPHVSSVLAIASRINIILGAFNLLPIPPLDGSRALVAFLPAHAQEQLARIEPYSLIILVVLLFTGILRPVINAIQGALYTAVTALF
jgi:Zn-dependent protease